MIGGGTCSKALLSLSRMAIRSSSIWEQIPAEREPLVLRSLLVR